MKSRFLYACAVAALLANASTAQSKKASDSPSTNSAKMKIEYPQVKKVEQVDDYHGTKVADPYRWLEDGTSADTKAWVEAQNKVTFGYLEKLPYRSQIKDRLTQLWNYERYGVPQKQGNWYFFSKNNGLQNQSVVYKAKSLDATPEVLLDPNTLSTDGTVALSSLEFSQDGNLLVYGTQSAGSDWVEFRVRDVATNKDHDDLVKWVKFSGASLAADNSGFFYSRYPEPKAATQYQDKVEGQQLYFHKIGTPQSQDALIYERPDEKQMGFSGGVTDDGKYLIIHVWEGSAEKNRIYWKDLTKANAPIVKLFDKFDASYNFIDNDGSTFYFTTTNGAPKTRIISVDVNAANASEPSAWKTLVPESENPLSSADLVGGQFIAEYLKDAHSQIKVYGKDGKLVREVSLPGIGNVGGFSGKKDDTESFYSYSSYTRPTTIYRYDVKTGQSTIFKEPKVAFDPNQFETKQVFYNSKDGTRVPMFISYKKGLKLDGSNPTYLYGYGGFNISQTPNFSVSALVFMEMGGVYAVANLRGGGEYGEKWHEAGTRLQKQNVFDDFIAAGEYLIAQKYTSKAKLSCGGGSNGGLLVGAVVNQRPDLWAAALPAVGVMDMLRFHKFTIGHAWTSDYGSSDNADEFKAIYAYSPLHNIKPGTKYPAVLVTTADHDDRVVPAHSFKYASTLQAAQAGDKPILIRIETKAGHGAGKPVSKTIEEAADKWAFLVNQLGMKIPESWTMVKK